LTPRPRRWSDLRCSNATLWASGIELLWPPPNLGKRKVGLGGHNAPPLARPRGGRALPGQVSPPCRMPPALRRWRRSIAIAADVATAAGVPAAPLAYAIFLRRQR